MNSKSVKQLWELYGYEPSEGDADEGANQRIITEEELDSLTAGYPVFLRNNLDWSFFGLERVLKRNQHITESWRELVKTFRETSGPRPDTVVCKTEYGVVFKSKALIDSHSFKYPELNFALFDLVEALDAIANFDPSSHMSEVIYKEAKRISQQRAADAKHDGSTGKRSAKDRIREIWALGKYSSRDICAEQECAALGMSFSTARKALRGTPDPA